MAVCVWLQHGHTFNKLRWKFSSDLKSSRNVRVFSLSIKTKPSPYPALHTSFYIHRNYKDTHPVKCLSPLGYNSRSDHRTYSRSAHIYRSQLRLCLLYQCDPEWYSYLSLPLFYLTYWSLFLLAGRGTFGEAVADSIFSHAANGLAPCNAMSHPRIRALYNSFHSGALYPSSFPWQLSATSGHRSGAGASVSDTDTWGVEWRLVGTLCWSRGRLLGWCNCWSSLAKRWP